MYEMRIYLLNNTKPYHDEDDGYSGDWFNCPVDFEEVKEKLGVEMEGTPVGNEMKAIQQKWFSSFDEFIDHKEEIRYYDVGDGAALAEYLIREENIFGEIPHELLKHIDYHSYGNELEMDDRYQ